MSIKKSQAIQKYVIDLKNSKEYGTAGHLVFWNDRQVLSVTKHGLVFWAQRKPNAKTLDFS